MAKISMRKVVADVTKNLELKLKAPNFLPAYLNRVVYGKYKEAQDKRWQTYNLGWEFTGGEWAALSPRYAEWKEKNYGIDRILFRTGRLLHGVIYGNKTVTDHSLNIYTTVEYAPYMNCGNGHTPARPFDTWSPEFKQILARGFYKYVNQQGGS